MSFLVNFMIDNGFSNQNSFYLLMNLIENIFPLDYFTTMEGLVVDQVIFKNMIQFYLPKMDWFFEKIKVDIQIISIKWFICAFTNSGIHFNVNIMIYV